MVRRLNHRLTMPCGKLYFEVERSGEMSDLVVKLKGFFQKRSEVLLAFLFGSEAAGRAREDSDVDIAILVAADFDASMLLDLRSELCSMLGRDVDISVLNDASPILKMQVLQKGLLLKDCTPPLFPGFYAGSLKEYEDLKYFRRNAEKKLLQRAVNG